MIWHTKLDVAQERCPMISRSHRTKKSSILTRIGRFQAVIPVWIHRWIWNDAQSCFVYYRRGALLFFDVIHQISRSQGLKNRFGISLSNFMRMLIVAIGKTLLIFSDVTFKMATWRPYWIVWFPDSLSGMVSGALLKLALQFQFEISCACCLWLLAVVCWFPVMSLPKWPPGHIGFLGFRTLNSFGFEYQVQIIFLLGGTNGNQCQNLYSSRTFVEIFRKFIANKVKSRFS